MVQAEKVLSGFIVTASILCLVITLLWLPIFLNFWVAIGLTAVLAAPMVIRCAKYFKKPKGTVTGQTQVRKAKNALMALQGFGFACWFFDVLSTVFVIDIKHASSELNPLGWPLSAVGALVYFVPITFVAYYLLFKRKSKETFYGAVVITGISIFMGLRNLGASLWNLLKIDSFAAQPEDYLILVIWLAVTLALAAFNVSAVVKNRKTIAQNHFHFNSPPTSTQPTLQ